MTNTPYFNNDLDYYAANDDWIGRRDLTDTHELIQFHNNSATRIWYNEQNSDFEPHWHMAMELIMPIENYYDAEINQTRYRVWPGELLVIPMGELHTLIAPETGRRFIYLFDMTFITKLKGFARILPLLAQPVYITKAGYPLIYDDLFLLLEKIRKEYFGQSDFAELTIFSLLLDFFAKLGYAHVSKNTLFPDVTQPKQKEYIKKFNQILDYIDTHYTEDLNLENMALLAGFSKFHFSRLFKQYTNFTFNDYLNHRRLKAAEELLAEPELPIIEVSLRSGYASLSTFNRLFKQAKHCTPSEYRLKNCVWL